MFQKPTLILNESICRDNIAVMVEKAKRQNITLRPHFKTHQSHEVGRWFREFGIDRITVSSVPMAQYFAEDGWDDITIAFPFVEQQAEHINNLAKITNLKLLASSLQNAETLSRRIKSNVDAFIEIDTGQGRSGIIPENYSVIESIINLFASSKNIAFKGFLTHAGHSYQSKLEDMEAINADAIKKISILRESWADRFPELIVSYGDTPTSSVCTNFQGVDELRPGNFAFFDMQQASRGVCSVRDIALCLACPVVAVYPNKNKAIIWGGAIHLSKDFFVDKHGKTSFGAICKLNSDLTHSEPIEGLWLESLSQEHGVIGAANRKALARIKEGELIAVLPAHSCLTVNAMRRLWISNRGFFTIMNQ